MTISSDTDAWIRAISRKFARSFAKEAAMDVRYIPVVLMEDEPVHTDEHPFCSDVTCDCHYDGDLTQEHLLTPVADGLLTSTEAMRLWRNEQV